MLARARRRSRRLRSWHRRPHRGGRRGDAGGRVHPPRRGRLRDHRDPAMTPHLGAHDDPAMFDIVIVGGGSAGGVLASRLSEDPARSVLLPEGGAAYGVDGYPDALRDAAHVPGDPEHDWGFTARGGPLSPKILAPRGKTLGGSSAVNATVAMRARPSDIRARPAITPAGNGMAFLAGTTKAVSATSGNLRTRPTAMTTTTAGRGRSRY